MAKTRALRRAAREADRERRISAARERNERVQKKSSRRIAQQPSLIDATRRRRGRTALFFLLFANALVWILNPQWSIRGIALVVSLLVAPIIAVLFVGGARV